MGRISEIWQRANEHADEVYYAALSKLLAEYGTQVLRSPRSLYSYLLDVIPTATELKMSVDAEELFLFNLAQDYVPDSWEDLEEMLRVSQQRETTGISIIKPPIGTPPEIANAWVGLTIPFNGAILTPLVFITPELAGIGLKSTDRKGYVVRQLDAIAEMEKRNPAVAEACKRLWPHWQSQDQTLIFDGDSSRIVTGH